MQLSVVFRRRFKSAVKRSGMTLAQLARRSSNSPSKIQSIANGEFDNSKDGPGLFGVHRATTELGIGLDELAPPNKLLRPDVNQFLSCFQSPDQPISNFQSVIPFCDVYHKPLDGMTRLKRLGPGSLLVEVSNINDPALLQIEYEAWSANRRRHFSDRQVKAWTQGHYIDSEIYAADFVQTSLKPRLSLIVAACRVRDFDRKLALLVFAERLRKQP